MTYLVAGLLLFFGVHSIAIVAPAWRDGMAAKLGDAPWKAIYSLVSVIGFVMLVHGYGLARAEPTVLYTPPAWMRHAAALLMLPVFPLLLSTYLPGRIKAAVKHPMLTATKAWALAHLVQQVFFHQLWPPAREIENIDLEQHALPPRKTVYP